MYSKDVRGLCLTDLPQTRACLKFLTISLCYIVSTKTTNRRLQLYYRSLQQNNVTFEGRQDRQNLVGPLEALCKHGPSLNIPTFSPAVHRSSIHGWQRLALQELEHSCLGSYQHGELNI